MKKTFLIVLTIFSISLNAQKDTNIYDFFGGKTTNKDVVFYRLLFQIDNGIVSGYAFTDEQGKNATKSVINGVFDVKTNTIKFKETQKLVTKSKENFKNLCFLNGTVSLSITPKISKIKGAFTEKNTNGEICNSGEIEIISLDAYTNLLKTITLEKTLINKPKPNNTKLPTFNNDKKITIKDDEEVRIFWYSDKFTLTIWDDAKEDEDQISIKFNDKIILNKHTLKNKKETLTYLLKNGENRITFTAENTGFIANNTARVDLFDTKTKHQIITKLKLKKSVTVILVRN